MASFETRRGAGGTRTSGALWGMALLLLAAAARAEVVPDLYAVSVPVVQQSQDELKRAAGVGLSEVAVRVTGRSDVAGSPALAPLLANAMHYLDQYRYDRNSGGDVPWLAQLRFSERAVDEELHKAGLPVWGENRPALQTFVVLDDQGQSGVIAADSPQADVLRAQWLRRGLVLHLPLSAGSVGADAVARLDAAAVAPAVPPGRDGVVLARIELAANGACNSDWQLDLGAPAAANAGGPPGAATDAGADAASVPTAAAQPLTTQATGGDLATCVASALDRLVDNVSPQYAIAAGSGAEGLVVSVAGVANFDDYAALLAYLRGQTLIQAAQPVSLHGDEVLVQLSVEGSTAQLARQLALAGRLSPIAGVADAPVPVALSYRWAAQPH